MSVRTADCMVTGLALASVQGPGGKGRPVVFGAMMTGPVTWRPDGTDDGHTGGSGGGQDQAGCLLWVLACRLKLEAETWTGN